MSQRINLRQANQHLSRYIRQLAKDGEIIITNRSRPVAKLVAIGEEIRLTPVQRAAKKRVFAKLRKGYPLNIGKFNRDEIYGD